MIWMLVLLTFANGEPQFQYDKRIFTTEPACQQAAGSYFTGQRWDGAKTFWRCTDWHGAQ